MFGYEDYVRLPSHAGPQGQVTRVTSHHFDDLDPAMRAGRGTRSLNDLRYVAECSIKPEGIVGTFQVLIDCLWNADYIDATLGELHSHAQSVFAAAHHERIEFQLLDILQYFFRPVPSFSVLAYLLKRFCSRRSKVGSPV